MVERKKNQMILDFKLYLSIFLNIIKIFFVLILRNYKSSQIQIIFFGDKNSNNFVLYVISPKGKLSIWQAILQQ